MGDSVQLQLAGETVELLGERALYRPAHRALLIADLHLGKADVFRRAGIGLPAGGTAHDLERLDALLAHRDVQALWILGDLLHGPAPRAAWHRRWSAWREQHCALRVIAIRGNHDRALAGADLHIEAAGEQVKMARSYCATTHCRTLPVTYCAGICIHWPSFRGCRGAGRRSGCANASPSCRRSRSSPQASCRAARRRAPGCLRGRRCDGITDTLASAANAPADAATQSG